MLKGSDCGLNLGLVFDNSLQKVLTRTMLNQEEIFRNQVLELHRLYKVQKILMKDEFKVSGEESPRSFVGPFSETLKCESLAREMKLSELHMEICSSGPVENQCLEEQRGTFEHQRISLDLKLAGNHYASDCKNILRDCITPQVSASMKHGIHDGNESSVDMPKLSLRAEVDTWQKGSAKRTCKDKIMCSPLLQAVHLEGSNYGRNLITIPARGYATHATHSGAKNEFEKICSFRRRKDDASNWISDSQSITDGSTNLLEVKHFFQGVEECHEDLSCKNVSARRKLFTSHDVGELDLNKALPEESSVWPIDPWSYNAPQSKSSGVPHNEVVDYGKDKFFTVLDPRQPKNNYSTESCALAPEDITVSTLTTSPSKDAGEHTTSPSKDAGEHICESTLCSVGFGSVCGSLSDIKNPVSGSRNCRPKHAASEIHLPEKTCRRISMLELNIKKKKGDRLCSHDSSQEPLEGADSNRSPVSCKSDWMTDDISSNTKTGQCVIDMPNSNVSPSAFRNSESSPVAAKIIQQNVISSSEMKSESSDPEKEKSAEVDVMVRKGAVSLIYFSLECLARNQDYGPEPRERKESCNVEREVPQSSSESYESIVLKQPECSVDDYCVSSTPSELTGLEKKDHGVKLKRGRRMKDFRKEILPGLASLSRQEICEDIKIMELALRSREYKKHMSKTASRSDCITPVRSKRSRLRFVGQRYYW